MPINSSLLPSLNLSLDYYSNNDYKIQTKSPVALGPTVQTFADAACQFQDAES